MEKQFKVAALVCCLCVVQGGYFSGVSVDDPQDAGALDIPPPPPDISCGKGDRCPGVCPSLKLPKCSNYKCTCIEELPPTEYIGCKGATPSKMALNPDDPTCRSYIKCHRNERFEERTCKSNYIFDVTRKRCRKKETVYCPLRPTVEIDSCQEYLDVAIVGAGPGGAYSAYKMRHSPKTIGLFEYSNRIGGRTYDFKLSNTRDVLLKLGAMRLVRGAQPLIVNVLKDIGLDIRPFTQGGDHGRLDYTRQFLRGQSLTMQEVLYGSVPYFLDKEETHNQHRLLKYYVEKLTGFNETFANRSTLLGLKLIADGRFMYEISFDEMLDLAASPDGKQFMQDKVGFTFCNNPDVSALMVLDFEMGIDAEFESCSKTYLYKGRNISSNVWEITKGHQEMTKTLVSEFMLTNIYQPSAPENCKTTGGTAKCKHTQNMNLKLDSIKTLPDGQYKLNFWPTYTSDYKTHINITSARRQVCAKQVILAMSQAALKEVDWEPLKYSVKNVYNAVTGVKVNKIFMTFKDAWWLNTSFTENASNVTIRDMLTGAIYDWKKSNTSGDYILLASYADNENAEYMRQLQDTGYPINGSATGAHRVSQGLWEHLRQSLALTFGVHTVTIPFPTSSVAQFWTDYPFGHGWVSLNKGYNFDDVTSAMMQPSLEDAVYVVGSDYAWGSYVGWCEGAFETVKAVLQKFFPKDVAGVGF